MIQFEKEFSETIAKSIILYAEVILDFHPIFCTKQNALDFTNMFDVIYSRHYSKETNLKRL